mgnify:CR=1 FL=1
MPSGDCWTIADLYMYPNLWDHEAAYCKEFDIYEVMLMKIAVILEHWVDSVFFGEI